MAQVPPEAIQHALEELALPLVTKAFELADGQFHIAPGASEDEVMQARATTAAMLAVQAVLMDTPLNELGALAALASVSATVLAQCQGDRKQLYAVFRAQFARVLAEVHEAQLMGRARPVGHA